jgi:hypothetical protein
MFNQFSRTISAGTTFLSPADLFVRVDTSEGAVTVVLPNLSTVFDYVAKSGNFLQSIGIRITDVSNNASINNITVKPADGDVLNNTNQVVLSTNGVGGIIQVLDYGSWTYTPNYVIDPTQAGGSGLINGKIIFVGDTNDLPSPNEFNEFVLGANINYFITDLIDLEGGVLIGGENTTIIGGSSENCILTSTGLNTSTPLLQTIYSTPVRHIAFKDVGTAFDINGASNPQPVAIDWTGVNFVNVTNVGTVKDVDNFIFDKGAFLGAQNLTFTGTIGTVGFGNSLFQGDGSDAPILRVDSTANITRRFRAVLCPFIAFGNTKAISFDPLASVPTESYILDTCNFSGDGTRLVGVDDTSNKALFVNNVGITNTSVNGQLYMQNNATATVVSVQNTWYKLAGTTTASSDNQKFSHSNNRLTCQAAVSRRYLIMATVSFSSGNNNVVNFGFFDSRINGIRPQSITSSTANASGRAESVTFMCVLEMVQGDYLEVHTLNETGANNITGTELNFVITQIN